MQADQVVIAAGLFSAKLAALLGVDLPLEVKPRHKMVIPDLSRDAPMTIDDNTVVHGCPAV